MPSKWTLPIRALSYHDFSTHDECPKHFEYVRLSGVEPPLRDDTNAFPGLLIQRFFEFWIKEARYREADRGLSYLSSDEVFAAHVKFIEMDCHQDFDTGVVASVATLWRQIRHIIIQKLDAETLGSPSAEVPFDVEVEPHVHIRGRVDFLFEYSDGSFVIADGKASKYRDRYLSADQLHFYALAFSLMRNRIPKQLAWLHYRFGEWQDIPVSLSDLKQMRRRVLAKFVEINRGSFPAHATQQNCRWCDWRSVCPEGKMKLHPGSDIADDLCDQISETLPGIV